jgi:hypothetical protein
MQTQISHELRIPVSSRVRWHHKRSLTGVALEGSLSQRSKARPRLDGWLRRLRTGHLCVMEVSAKPAGGALVLTCDRSRQLVYITVRRGNPVCVNVSRVVAMTDNVFLRTRLHLAVPAMWMGHASVCYAECCGSEVEGAIVVETCGEAVALSQDAQFSIDRLVAWGAEARFCLSPLDGLYDVVATQPLVKATCVEGRQNCVLLEPAVRGSEPTVVARLLQLVRLLLPL